MGAQSAVLMRAPAVQANERAPVALTAGTFRPPAIDYQLGAPGRTLAPHSFADVPVFAPTERANPVSPALPRITLQRKLAIDAVDDPLEREADRVADKVMRKPGGQW